MLLSPFSQQLQHQHIEVGLKKNLQVQNVHLEVE